MEFCVVLVTVPDAKVGEKIARGLVEEKLAACVNRAPQLTSIYSWQGKIESASEELLIVKTRRSCLNTLTEKVKSWHPYEVPEIIALPIIAGSQDYLDWLAQETRESGESAAS